MHTTTTETAPVVIICTECGDGCYYSDPFLFSVAECAVCGHHVAASDIDLEAGERLTFDARGRLAYIPAAD